MNKKVTYKGKVVTVQFSKDNFTKETIILDEKKRKGINKGTRDFIINGTRYLVHWNNSFNGYDFSSSHMHFEGFTCCKSDKKMIEHIIEKYGL